MNSPIKISDRDMRRIRPLVETRAKTRALDAANLVRLSLELDRAEVVPAADLPHEIIAMNSVVELENLSSGERMTFTLVYPEDADADRGRICVLAPLGSAMLGYREGDAFEWPTPGGMVRMTVRRVISAQHIACPEQAGVAGTAR